MKWLTRDLKEKKYPSKNKMYYLIDIAFLIFLPRFKGYYIDVGSFQGFASGKTTDVWRMSNHVIKCSYFCIIIWRLLGCNRQTHFSMSIWNWQLEWLLDNTIERVHKIVSYIACEMGSHIEIVDIYACRMNSYTSQIYFNFRFQ